MNRKTIYIISWAKKGLQSQETDTIAGGDATDIGGSPGYNLGQVTHSANTGINASANSVQVAPKRDFRNLCCAQARRDIILVERHPACSSEYERACK